MVKQFSGLHEYFDSLGDRKQDLQGALECDEVRAVPSVMESDGCPICINALSDGAQLYNPCL
jgi:hypothetical protein